ncbi:MAG: hypothetical protein H0V96_09180 [Acidimicrobiia bacterium]|nr:hypothetical protein [Acidimicrobiia bacterium]
MFNRSDTLSGGAELDQSDGTAWMACYTLEMFKIAVELAAEEPVTRTWPPMGGRRLADRVLSLFLAEDDGPPPSLRGRGGLVPDPSWHTEPLFHEYFHGDSGSHQTGWTGLVANLLDRRAQRRPG